MDKKQAQALLEQILKKFDIVVDIVHADGAVWEDASGIDREEFKSGQIKVRVEEN